MEAEEEEGKGEKLRGKKRGEGGRREGRDKIKKGITRERK